MKTKQNNVDRISTSGLVRVRGATVPNPKPLSTPVQKPTDKGHDLWANFEQQFKSIF